MFGLRGTHSTSVFRHSQCRIERTSRVFRLTNKYSSVTIINNDKHIQAVHGYTYKFHFTVSKQRTFMIDTRLHWTLLQKATLRFDDRIAFEAACRWPTYHDMQSIDKILLQWGRDVKNQHTWMMNLFPLYWFEMFLVLTVETELIALEKILTDCLMIHVDDVSFCC